MFIEPKDIGAIYFRVAPIDFRKGIFGLAAAIDQQNLAAKDCKSLFVFTDRTRRKVKILYWDDSGYAMWMKILDGQKFLWPKRAQSEIRISVEQLQWLLSGIDIDAVKRHKKSSAALIY